VRREQHRLWAARDDQRIVATESVAGVDKLAARLTEARIGAGDHQHVLVVLMPARRADEDDLPIGFSLSGHGHPQVASNDLPQGNCARIVGLLAAT
jgi:hypothetical protein